MVYISFSLDWYSSIISEASLGGSAVLINTVDSRYLDFVYLE